MPIDKTPYTPGMREVLKISKAEAGRLGHEYIGPEHYLLAVIRKGDGLGIQTLMNLDVDLEGVKKELERMVDTGKGPRPTVGLFWHNADAKRVLETSKQIANEFKHGWVGTEHVLLALSKQEDTVASRCLRDFGVDFDKAKQEVIGVIEGSQKQARKQTPKKSATPTGFEIGAVPSQETRYTSDVREVLALSKIEARRLGHEYIGPGHILLGMLREKDCLAFHVLKKLDVDIEGLRGAVEEKLKAESGPTVYVFTHNAEAQRTLNDAKREAGDMRLVRVGSEHLLLALIKQEHTAAGRCLIDVGVEFDKAKEELIKFIEKNQKYTSATTAFDLCKVFERARNEAQARGAKAVAAEHYLLALLSDQKGIGALRLGRLNVGIEDLKLDLLNQMEVESPSESDPTSAARVLEAAIEIADQRRRRVDADCFLLALTRVEDTIASRTLRQFGVDYHRLLAEIIRFPQ